jgi:mono/diheme cytochrome c family protein
VRRVRSAECGLRTAVTAALVFMIAACGSARRSEPIASAASNDPEVQRGAVLFDRHCDKCHTGGEAAMGPSIANKPLPEFLMQFQARHGLGTMPGFKKDQISDAELEAITKYLRSLRGSESSTQPSKK